MSIWEIILKSHISPEFFLRATNSILRDWNHRKFKAFLSSNFSQIDQDLACTTSINYIDVRTKKAEKPCTFHSSSQCWDLKNTPQKAFMYLNWAKKMVAYSLLRKAEGNLSSIFFLWMKYQVSPLFSPIEFWIKIERITQIFWECHQNHWYHDLGTRSRSRSYIAIASEISLDFGWF